MVARRTGAAGNLLADQLVVADLGSAGFKIVRNLVIIMRDAAEQRFLNRPAKSSRPVAEGVSRARGTWIRCPYHENSAVR
jgi:hypothetical protein